MRRVILIILAALLLAAPLSAQVTVIPAPYVNGAGVARGGISIPAAGGLILADGAVSPTTNALYNVGGALYFNGVAVGGGSQTPWTANVNAAGYTLFGSDAANGDLTLEATSSATRTTSYVFIAPSGGNVGIGTGAVAPRYKNTTIGVLSTLLSDGSTNYEGLTITPSSGAVTLAFVSGGTGAASGNIPIVSKGVGWVSVGNTTPPAWPNAKTLYTGTSALRVGDETVLQAGETSAFGNLLGSNTVFDSDVASKYLTADFASSVAQYGGNIILRTALSGTAGAAITWTGGYTLDSANKSWWMTTGTPTATNREGLSLTLAAGSATFAAETNGTGTDNINLVLTPAGTGTVSTGAGFAAASFSVGATAGVDCTSAAAVTVSKGIVTGCSQPAASPEYLLAEITSLKQQMASLMGGVR